MENSADLPSFPGFWGSMNALVLNSQGRSFPSQIDLSARLASHFYFSSSFDWVLHFLTGGNPGRIFESWHVVSNNQADFPTILARRLHIKQPRLRKPRQGSSYTCQARMRLLHLETCAVRYLFPGKISVGTKLPIWGQIYPTGRQRQ